MSSAAPVDWIASDSGISPAIRITVVHDTARYACSVSSTPSSTSASAARRPATAAGTRPAASAATKAAVTASVRRAPGPSATTWRRTAAGASTTSTSSAPSRSSSARHEPSSSSVSPAARAQLPRRRRLALALHGQDHEVAALGDHAGEDDLADQRRPRRHDDLRDAGLAREELLGDLARARAGLERVLVDEDLRLAAEVGRQRPRPAIGQQPVAERERRGRRSRRRAGRRRARTRRTRTARRPRRRRPPTRGC